METDTDMIFCKGKFLSEGRPKVRKEKLLKRKWNCEAYEKGVRILYIRHLIT